VAQSTLSTSPVTGDYSIPPNDGDYFMPTVSVVIPAYNSGATIVATIESVLQQTYADYEIIVVDDGSTDDTRVRVDAFGARVRYAYQSNSERSAARNHGIRLARGKYIAFLDADDQWLPDKLAKQVALLERKPELALVYCWANLIDPAGYARGFIGQDFPIEQAENCQAFEGLALGRSIPTLTVIVRAECLTTTGVFDENICYGEDWDLWLRFALQYPIGFVPEPLANYQLNGSFLPQSMARCHAQETRPQTIRQVFERARHLNKTLPEHLEHRALAHAWWRSSLIQYAVQHNDDAQVSLTRAFEFDRASFVSRQFNWIEDLIAFAIFLYDTGAPPPAAESFVARVFDHLPECARPLGAYRRQVLGKLKAGYAFQAQARGDTAQARTLMRNAIAYYPALARNLGVVSICLRDTWLDRLRRGARSTST
jgi:glycosyltransferase involved in cell wall biosynthesis